MQPLLPLLPHHQAIAQIAIQERFVAVVTVDRVEVLAEPIFQGRTQQLWQVSITRLRDGKLVARGQLRLQNLPLPDDSSEGPSH